MRIARTIWLAMAATLCASGCRAWNPGPLALSPRPPGEISFDVDKFVAEHNRNAERVQSLEAKPTIVVASRIMKASANGRLALERPRNFKLELSDPTAKKADIGSNHDEFWFWVSNDKDKAIYWCDYQDLDSSALAITYQPDWIIEALGLKPITAQEAARIKVHKGEVRGTTALVFPPSRSGADTYTRVMIVWNETQRIKQHRIYTGNLQSAAPNPKALVAQADVSQFADFDAGSAETADGEKCYLPENIKLDWKRDQLTLDVALREVKVNEFDPARSAAIFVEPVIPHHERVNLAQLNRAHRKDSRTTVRHTLPPPDPRSGVKLGRPTPLPDDTTMAPGGPSGLAQGTRAATTSPLEDLVTPPLPVGPETAAMQAANAAAARAPAYQMER
jgi:hypothetical protein